MDNPQKLPPFGQASVFDVRDMAEKERDNLGHLVLVMRRWPQGISWEAIGLNLWLPDAGPSLELLKAYQTGQINWELFAQRYQAEQLGNWRRAGYYKLGKGKEGKRASQVSPLNHLRELRERYGVVTVLCHERQGNCHRHILVQLLDEGKQGDQATVPFCRAELHPIRGNGGDR